MRDGDEEASPSPTDHATNSLRLSLLATTNASFKSLVSSHRVSASIHRSIGEEPSGPSGSKGRVARARPSGPITVRFRSSPRAFNSSPRVTPNAPPKIRVFTFGGRGGAPPWKEALRQQEKAAGKACERFRATGTTDDDDDGRFRFGRDAFFERRFGQSAFGVGRDDCRAAAARRAPGVPGVVVLRPVDGPMPRGCPRVVLARVSSEERGVECPIRNAKTRKDSREEGSRGAREPGNAPRGQGLDAELHGGAWYRGPVASVRSAARTAGRATGSGPSTTTFSVSCLMTASPRFRDAAGDGGDE